jgi:ankyrin repeat protein
MRGRRVLIAALVPIAAVAACVGSRSLQGPVRGRAELSDGARPDDLVAHLDCRGGGIHGTHRADQALRVFRADERFLFPWAWRGVAPAGCSVEILHPLYRMQYVAIERRFSVDLGTVRLEAWETLLAGSDGATIDDVHRHLFYLRHYYLAAFAGDARARLARYVPTLHALYERGLDVLPSTDVDRFGANHDYSLKTLRQIEEAVGYARPARQEELFAAAAAGDVSRVRALLREGVDPDAWNADRAAAIHLAARAGHSEVVLALIDGGADVDRQQFGRGDSALLVALHQGEAATALALLERGADPALACRATTPLMVAARSGQLDVVRALIERGALERVRELRHRDAALAGAAGGGYAEIVRALLAAGVPVDAGLPGWSALMHAARNGQLRTAEILLDAGADLDAVSMNGKTALALAREEGRSEMVALLAARGASE